MASLMGRRACPLGLNAREMPADWGETGPKLYADWRARGPHAGSETAILEQHEGVVGTP